MSCQTDSNLLRGKSPVLKTIRLQTENFKDIYKTDWSKSRIYQLALKQEADKRGIRNSIVVSSDDGHTTDGASVSRSFSQFQRTPKQEREAATHQQNAQDPDTDMVTDNETGHYINTAIGFFKNFKR